MTEETLNRARALLRERRPHEAVALLEPLPGDAAALFLLGVAHAEQGDLAPARAALSRSFALEPRQPAAHRFLFARVLLDSGDASGAEAQARQAVDADPSFARGHAFLARRLHQRAALVEAVEHFRRALALDAGDADLWNELGVALTDAGRLGEARDAYRECLARRPDYHQVGSNLLVNLHYDPTIGADAMFEAHREWARRHAAALRPVTPPARAARTGRLRVGFLSPAFTAGPTAAFLRPVLMNLDPMVFEAVGFNVGYSDATSEALRQRTAAWHEMRAASDEEVAGRIVEEGIDVLVDLAGHTPGGRPLVLARKPAPVIATWLDYFDTTGLDAVDYLLGDPVSTPPGGPQRFTERVVMLKPARLCYSPPEYAPPVAEAPAARDGFVTFGSFNRHSKIAAPVVALWARVLGAVAGSRLIVKNAALADAPTGEALLRGFEAHGIDRARIELRAHSPHAQMLAEYGDVDIALDTFPYNGGLTTCEALWMGVPVVTILGDAMISRQGASLLAAAEMGQWVARDAEELVAKCVSAADPASLAGVRGAMRGRLAATPLVDGASFSRAFEAALLAMHEDKALR